MKTHTKLSLLCSSILLLSACAPTNKTMEESVAYESASKVAGSVANQSQYVQRQAVIASMPAPYPQAEPDRERYQDLTENSVKLTATDPVSTLSLDADTGSYANVRRYLSSGSLPPVDAVRIEELLNYFSYDAAKPESDAPFSISTELASAPWSSNQLLKIAVKAVDVSAAEQPAANLVFLVDVSGSMDANDKLELAKSSLKLLTKSLRKQDKVSMVVYAGRTAVELPSTSGDQTSKILQAIERLEAAGSTAGEAALNLAYEEAQQNFIKGGINRILLMTDGDFNVGISDTDQIIDLVKRNRDRGISLSTFGFGTGNYNEHLMEQIADAGNGNYSYIDSLLESKKVLSDELSATFNTVAKDVKLQIEFNPAAVKEWRLIGYENRVLAEQDFNNDKVDAAEVGAGKSLVALYEITPVGEAGLIPPRRYGSEVSSEATKEQKTKDASQLGYLKMRYKDPEGRKSKLINRPISSRPTAPSSDMKFAAAVAGFGQLLKNSDYRGDWSYADSAALAKRGLGVDQGGYRAEFINLVELADSLSPSGSAD